MKNYWLTLWICLFGFGLQAQSTRLLRMPDINNQHVTFVYANDIWIANADGKEVKRLTSFQGAELWPHFSPDGQYIAFSGQYDGNTDVYIVPIGGGEPQRLTFHPSVDLVKGWSPDGSTVLFSSGRNGVPQGDPCFWKINRDGGFPEQLPLDRVSEGHLSPDGTHLAYQKVDAWESEFRNYRGGQTNPIRILNLSTLVANPLPWNGSNDLNPVYVNDVVYFLSDRDHASNVWSYNPGTRELKQISFFTEFDCKHLESGDGRIVFENGGFLYSYDHQGINPPQKIDITVQGDRSWARPHWQNVDRDIMDAAISPTGKRAVFSARGDIFTVPANDGHIRNLTQTSGAAERSPVWSPDGKWISWFSDESGEYQLNIADQKGGQLKKIVLPDMTFAYTPAWSPDSKYLSYGDADRNLWLVEINTGNVTKIDNEGFAHPQRTIYPEWAPDSRFIAYTKRLENEYNAIFIYHIAENRKYQITNEMADNRSPAWDPSGKYIYFLSSNNLGLNVGWLDMSSLERPLRYSIYLAVLNPADPSPLIPKSDEEDETDDSAKDQDAEQEVQVVFDINQIENRIVALDLPARNYTSLSSGGKGILFYTENVENKPGVDLHRYNLDERKSELFLSEIQNYQVAAGYEKILIHQKGTWSITGSSGKPEPGKGTLNLADMRMKIYPSQEWQQIFREAWRYQRDYFYVENVHGLDLDWAYNTYLPWVSHVRHRSDLNYILDILGGETSVGHSFNGGGDYPDVKRVPVGLLGADYAIENERYRIKKIFAGESWNPNLKAPLSGPAINVKEGDYILEVNGQPLRGVDNIYELFEYTGGKVTELTLNSIPSIANSRKVNVIPVTSEFGLRQSDWVESNRRTVDELSSGQLAYVWLPNTGFGGYNNFNRYYFAQKNKKGIIVDERFNSGGFAADYIVDLLDRELMGYFNNPVGDKQPFTSPGAVIQGPKVMIINEMAGSGGDYLPYMFKKKGIGTLVGKKTWGGLVGIWDVPPLIDGGYITAPRGGFYNTEGQWDVENKGVAPDVEVDNDPQSVAAGEDAQLIRAVEIAMEQMNSMNLGIIPQPIDPVRVRRPSNRQ